MNIQRCSEKLVLKTICVTIPTVLKLYFAREKIFTHELGEIYFIFISLITETNTKQE